MWWDERFASFDGAVTESDSQAKPSSQQLTASIALDSAYVRCALTSTKYLLWSNGTLRWPKLFQAFRSPAGLWYRQLLIGGLSGLLTEPS